MRLSDESLREFPGTGGMSPEGEDGELTAEVLLPIWLAVDAR
jgi:hypothetical protein